MQLPFSHTPFSVCSSIIISEQHVCLRFYSYRDVVGLDPIAHGEITEWACALLPDVDILLSVFLGLALQLCVANSGPNSGIGIILTHFKADPPQA